MKGELLKIVPAPKGSKSKYVAHFTDGTKTKKTSFGARGYLDYTQHRSVKRRDAYRARAEHNLKKTKDPTKASYLAYWILWGDSTSLRKNIADYRKKFNL